MTIQRSHRLDFFKLGLWDRGMFTGRQGQKPDWKKITSLSDSDMVTGGLTAILSNLRIFYR